MALLAPNVGLVSSGVAVLLVQPLLPTAMTVHKMDLHVLLVLLGSMVQTVLLVLQLSLTAQHVQKMVTLAIVVVVDST